MATHLAPIRTSLPVLSWLPDETLFSLASRIHRFWGHPLASTTATVLFGSARGGTQHDLPTHVDAFAQRTSGLLGDSATIGRTRTLYRYYRTFLPEHERRHVIDVLRGTTVAHLKLRLGIITSRFRAHHPLKACPICMQTDAVAYGWAYWHIQHQYPGAWICLRHGEPLLESMVKANGVGRFLWHLPDLATLRPWPTEIGEAFATHARTAVRLTRLIETLVEASEREPIETAVLVEACRVQLGKRGALTSGGSLRLATLAPAFLDYVGTLCFIPELGALPTSAEEAAAQLGRLLRAQRNGTHPIRWFLLIDWLFDSAADFLAVCKDIKEHGPRAGASSIPDPLQRSSPPLDDVRRLLGEERRSVRAAARVLDVSVATVMGWAAQCGLQPSLRPKRLHSGARNALIRDLSAGMDKAEAAARHRVSITTITHVLRTEPGLHAIWSRVRFDKAQTAARAAWCIQLAEQGQFGIKHLRGLEPASYAWLYRNDRAWLQAHAPPRLADLRSHGCRRDWGKRDAWLSLRVQEVALALRENGEEKCLRLFQLYQLIPELKSKLSTLEKLPLTRSALDEALRRPTASG